MIDLIEGAVIAADTYEKLMDALEYPERQRETTTFDEVLEDTLHMIRLGFKYLDEVNDF